MTKETQGAPGVSAKPTYVAPENGRCVVPDGVLGAELDDVLERRRQVGTATAAPDAEQKAEARRSLVGLALSGGGIRSAAFNLGLLQGLFRHGLLRHVDYLSTVSGGGYIGSWFSSLLLRFGPVSADNTKLSQRLLSQPGGRQPDPVVKLARNGKYLDHLAKAWSHYSIGLLYNNLAFVSVLVFLCLLLAYCWRAMDDHFAVYYFYAGTNYVLTETVRPFLPGLLLLVFWLAAWMLAYRHWLARRGDRYLSGVAGAVGVALGLAASGVFLVGAGIVVRGSPVVGLPLGLGAAALVGYAIHSVRRDRGRQGPGDNGREGAWARIAQVLFVLAAAALLIGTAVLLANPTTNTKSPFSGGQVSSANQISDKTRSIVIPLLGMLATALLPFLRPQRLLQSGLHPKNVWETRLFHVATSALLFGVPLALVWLFAQHDFFGRQNADRETKLFIGDVATFGKLHGRLESTTRGSPAAFVKDALATDPTWQNAWDAKEEARTIRERHGSTSEEARAAGGKVKEAMQPIEELDRVTVPIDEGLRKTKGGIIRLLNERVIDSEEFTRTAREYGNVRLLWPLQDFDQGPFFRNEVSRHPRADDIAALMSRHDQGALDADGRKTLNRLLLEATFPQDVFRADQVGRGNAIAADQRGRLLWLGVTFLVMVLAGLLVNLNATSMHSYYHQQLADTFIVGAPCRIPLHELNTTDKGAPYHLLSATLNTRPSDPAPSRLDGDNLGQTPTEGFLFSRHYCGSASKGYQATESYWGQRLGLDDAMAISGAAVSPLQISDWLIVALMVMFNARTGQWLPRPQEEAAAEDHPAGTWQRLRRWAARHLAGMAGPTLTGLVIDRLVSRRRQRQLYFLTDGGHHENLGLWPLLERRCRLVIVADASEDGTSGFADLLRVVRRARYEAGIRITCVRPPFEPDEGDEGLARLLELIRSTEEPTDEQVQRQAAEGNLPPSYRRSGRHFFLARIEYPEAPDGPGYLVYVKPSLTGDEDADLQAYAAQNRDFPHHPTPDQLYDEDRFESYRQLGEHIGDRLCDELRDGAGTPGLWESPSVLPIVMSESPDVGLLARQNTALERTALEAARRRRRVQRVEPTRLPETLW